MRIFLTGGTGFIGSHLLNAMGNTHEVVALRRAGSVPRIPLTHEPDWIMPRSQDDLEKALATIDVFIHLAAVGLIQKEANYEKCFQTNVTESVALWELAAARGVKHFVICGTCLEFGKSGELHDRIPANAPLLPLGPYAESKAAATREAVSFAARRQISLQLLRPFQVFGEGQVEISLWSSLQRSALTGVDFPMSPGQQIRDFVPVAQVAEGFIEALGTSPGPGLIRYQNIGTGHGQTLLKFATQWWSHFKGQGKLLPGAMPYRDDEIMRYVPDLTPLILPAL